MLCETSPAFQQHLELNKPNFTYLPHADVTLSADIVWLWLCFGRKKSVKPICGKRQLKIILLRPYGNNVPQLKEMRTVVVV